MLWDLPSIVVMWVKIATARKMASMVVISLFALQLVADRAAGDSVRSVIPISNWKSWPMPNCWNYCIRKCRLWGAATRDDLVFAHP